VPRYDGEIDIAALGNLAHGAFAAALGQASEEADACGVAEGFEEFGVEERVERGL